MNDNAGPCLLDDLKKYYGRQFVYGPPTLLRLNVAISLFDNEGDYSIGDNIYFF